MLTIFFFIGRSFGKKDNILDINQIKQFENIEKHKIYLK